MRITDDQPRNQHELGVIHESVATMFAHRGEWERAYRHLQAAMRLFHADTAATTPAQLCTEVDQLRREHAEAVAQSLRDSLTGVFNRRYLDERLAAGATQHCLALADIDWFKQVNDTYGHQLGDLVLKHVVALICAELPAGAFCARYGGEEFALVFPGLELPAATAVCETIRDRVERHAWQDYAAGLRVTISVGLTEGGRDVDGYQLVYAADRLLYLTKQSGRNAVGYPDAASAHGVALAGRAAARRIMLGTPLVAV